jgi:PGDYG protein
VKREIFDKIYEPVEATKPGLDGCYRGIVREVRALQLKEGKRLDLPDGRGVLRGGAGDWVVDYGDGDMSVVAEDVFAATYELLEAATE